MSGDLYTRLAKQIQEAMDVQILIDLEAAATCPECDGSRFDDDPCCDMEAIRRIIDS